MLFVAFCMTQYPSRGARYPGYGKAPMDSARGADESRFREFRIDRAIPCESDYKESRNEAEKD